MEDKQNSVFFISFLSLNKFIMLRRCFPLSYTCRLNISKAWFILGSSWFVSSRQSRNKAVCVVSAGRIKLFQKKLLTVAKCKSQSYIHWRYVTVSLLLYHRKSMMVHFSTEKRKTSYSKKKMLLRILYGKKRNYELITVQQSGFIVPYVWKI